MFSLIRTQEANTVYLELKIKALASLDNRKKNKKSKASKEEGLFKQLVKTLDFLAQNPRHPGLHTHSYSGFENPYNDKEKVFEAYVQNNTPGAYRVFWCYGPDKAQITIIAIIPHP